MESMDSVGKTHQRCRDGSDWIEVLFVSFPCTADGVRSGRIR